MHRTRIAVFAALAVALCISLPPARAQLGRYYASEIHNVIYPSPTVARADVQRAIARATRKHDRVLLDFGGNWCSDCVALYDYFHEPPNAGLLARNFVLVTINVGQLNRNVALAKKYDIPLKKGVPALAVLSSHGKLLYSQTGGQFNDMGRMSPDSVTAFLDMWKPDR